MNSESSPVPTEQPSTEEAGYRSKRPGDSKRPTLLWLMVMSVIALSLLIWAISSIGDFERAQRQLGVQTEQFHQYEKDYELTGRQDKIEYFDRLGKLKDAYFIPDTKGAILRVKLAATILVIFVQAVSLTGLLRTNLR